VSNRARSAVGGGFRLPLFRLQAGFTVPPSPTFREALDLVPDEIVFADDQPRNVDGACRVGLDALQFDVTRPGSSFAEVQSGWA